MRKYGILILLCLSRFSNAQEYDSFHNGHYHTFSEIEKKEGDVKGDSSQSPSSHTFTGNVSFVSDYRFRGISQTMRQPAVQAGFDYSHATGIYLGNWASNVDGTSNFLNNTSLEWDFYGGYKGKFFLCRLPDLTYNTGFIFYYYPGGKSYAHKSVPYNTGEIYFELTYKWLSVKYWYSVTDYFGICSDNPPFNWETGHTNRPNGSSRGSAYVEANATFDLYEKMCWSLFSLHVGKLNLALHGGHLTVRNYKHNSYSDWKVTLTQELDWFNLFLSYVGTDAKKAYFNVPNKAFHPKKIDLGVQSVVFGVIRVF